MFLSVQPSDLLVPGAVIWIPFLIWREVVRSRKHGFLPGFLVRAAVVVAVVFAAASFTPAKQENRRRIALTGTQVTLEELAREARMFGFPQEMMSRPVTLPSSRPTMREAMDAVEKQTEYRCTPGCCGNGITVLWGAHIISIRVAPK